MSARLALILACVPAICGATSAQIEMTEPILQCAPLKAVHGTAFVGAVMGSHLYDTAGNLGCTFRLLRHGDAAAYFHGDMFTYIENTGARFDPKRIVYTLEPGYVIPYRGADMYRLFIKHQSYHDVDFGDGIDESYELYGVSYHHGCRSYLSVGKYLNTKDVDYDWDFAASAQIAMGKGLGGDGYLRLWLHHVTERESIDGRDRFTDHAAELGVEYVSGISVFLRYEQLHDMDRYRGVTETHILSGIRYDW